MLEQENRILATREIQKSTFIIRRVIPHLLTIYMADKLLGEGLTEKGHKKLKIVIKKFLLREHVQSSSEVPQVYEDSEFLFMTEGDENIPTGGATLLIGNHTRSGPLYGMGQYFEVSRAVYKKRINVKNEILREPRAIAQRGLTKAIKFPGGSKFIWNLPFTDQFYDLAAECLNWVTVSPPRFDTNEQITNKQYLPKEVIDYLLSGGALLWFPQGKHQDANYLTMPEKSIGLLTKLKDEDVNLVAIRFIPGSNSLRIIFSEAVHIQDVPQEDGSVDIKTFVEKYMQRLGQ